MKEWKIMCVLLLVAVAGCLPAVMSDADLQEVQKKKALSDLQTRIADLEILKIEQTLTRDIMVIQQEVRELTLKAQAPPVIEGEFIPIDKVPENVK